MQLTTGQQTNLMTRLMQLEVARLLQPSNLRFTDLQAALSTLNPSQQDQLLQAVTNGSNIQGLLTEQLTTYSSDLATSNVEAFLASLTIEQASYLYNNLGNVLQVIPSN